MALLPEYEILHGLNDAQSAAVSSPSKVLQVLAPPGSGKTKTLTARVAYLITHHGLDPSRIIVCTFTVKAAREMQERIEKFIGADLAARLILGTFHSVARRLLVKYGHFIGLSPNFDIADTSDSMALITRIIKEQKLDIKPNVARNRISSMKSDGLGAEKYAVKSPMNIDPQKYSAKQQFEYVFAAYEEKHKVDNVLDYDDLLLYCRQLLTEHPYCVNRVDAVLIDEFQDTNNVQFDLMKLMAQKRRAVTIVGDPDQSIYGWRSAQIANLVKMREVYPDTHVVNLEENYRSSACILMAAQGIIEQDTHRHPKMLLATHSAGEQPVLRRLKNAHQEADWMTGEVLRCKDLCGGLLRWNDFAVLIRSAFLSRVLEQALGKAGIPYRMVGGHRFYDRVEVKIVLDYLRCISHTSHTEAMLRILNVPSRKVGPKAVTALLDKSAALQCPLWKVILSVSRGEMRLDPPLNAPTLQGLAAFVDIILSGQKRLQLPEPPATIESFARHVIEKLHFQTYLEREYKNEDSLEARKSNVDELMIQMREVDTNIADISQDIGDDEAVEPEAPVLDDDRGPSDQDPLSDRLAHFLAQVALSTDKKPVESREGDEGQLTISTMHAAKGLEWPVVFLPAVYDGSVPHSRAEDHDEERRLLYVAMTRAQALLYLSCPTSDTRRSKVVLSRFLNEGAVQATHQTRGPSFGYDLVRELAKILRRQEQRLDIEAGRASARRLEDDEYPEVPEETGEDEHAEHGSQTQYNSRKRPSENAHPPAKRLARVDNEGFMSAKALLTEPREPQAGFRTARMVLQEADKENCNPQRAQFNQPSAAKPTKTAGPTGTARMSSMGPKKQPRPDQATLSSLWPAAPPGKQPGVEIADGVIMPQLVRSEAQSMKTAKTAETLRKPAPSFHVTTIDLMKD